MQGALDNVDTRRLSIAPNSAAIAAPSGTTSQIELCSPFGKVCANHSKFCIRCGEEAREAG